MGMGKIQIDMLGTNFTVLGDEDNNHLKEIYAYYKKLVTTLQVNKKLDNPLQVSILAGMTLVDELMKEKAKNIVNRQSNFDADKMNIAEKMTNEMIKKIDNVL